MDKPLSKTNLYIILRKSSVLAQNTTTVFLTGCSFSYLIAMLFFSSLRLEGMNPLIFTINIYYCAISVFFFRPKGPTIIRLMIVISLLTLLSWWYFTKSDAPTEPSALLIFLAVFLIPISSIPAVVFNQK